MPSPEYDLSEVKSLVREWLNGRDTGWFSSPSCSVSYVTHLFEYTNIQAELVILNGLLSLDEDCFSESILQWGSLADVYGLAIYHGYNWYVKFIICDGVLEQISFHPCERDMTLANGRTLKSTIRGKQIPEWRLR